MRPLASFRLAILAMIACCAFAAHAQTYPNKPVRIIVSQAAGGGVDTLARLVAQKMTESLGQNGHRREQDRRGRHHRRHVRDQGASRRLHAAHGADRQRGVHADPLHQTAVLGATRPDARQHARVVSIDSCRQRVPALPDGPGARHVHEGQPRQVQLWRLRPGVPVRDGTVQDQDRHQARIHPVQEHQRGHHRAHRRRPSPGPGRHWTGPRVDSGRTDCARWQ